MFIVFVVSLVLSLALFIVIVFLGVVVHTYNKEEPFECGFIPVSILQASFSVQFFIVLVIFVIFDLEVVLIIPSLISGFYGITTFTFVMAFIVGGVYLEWAFGKLSWLV